MKEKAAARLSTESYKGVRDFYPEEMFVQNYIFDVMRKTAESFGFVEYEASILEPAELYRAKTGEEIVNEQTYTFKDRGGREVTLRPEMTPTVARMVAAKMREFPMPLRWYSIPNLFRYEQPQRGRLREHWQLNADIFGIDNEQADVEIIALAYQLFKNYGAKDEDFTIKINDRRIINELFELYEISPEKRQKLSKIIDKKEKISGEAFRDSVSVLLDEKAEKFIDSISSGKKLVEALGEKNVETKRVMELIDSLSNMGISNVTFEPTLMRGFDYYTGTVFEGFDSNEKNKRSLFGGGRYDDLLSVFGNEKLPAVGFGTGDVTIQDFLETHALLPSYKTKTDLYLCIMDETYGFGSDLAKKLRELGLNVVCDYTDKTVGDKIKKAVKDHVPYLAVVGNNEEKSQSITIKNLSSRKEKQFKIDDSGIPKIAEEFKTGKMVE